MSGLKKFTVCILCFAFFACCCIFSDGDDKYIPVSATATELKTVIIDAGHAALENTID